VFDEASVRARIASTRFARLHYARETGSTNDDAARLLGEPGGAIVLAEFQRSGRGRRGRRWISPAGAALLFTAVLPRTITPTTLWVVPYWCALAVRDGVLHTCGEALDLQWPNDLLLRGRKACGILSTSRVSGGEARVGCGVGLNVLRPSAGAEGGDPDAAYLSDAVGGISREDVLVAIVCSLDSMLDALDDVASIARAWEACAGLPGAAYRILVDGEDAPFECRALRLGPDGELVVAIGGRERHVALADARALRG
jgi:BirA family transcriptional regulator, biotin operon repressor / biotin---[acetyl-CoA-carboxylase] ligase